MTFRFWKTAIGAVVLSATLGAGAASAATRVYVRVAPPPLVVETRVVAPAPGMVWVPGYHRWNGSAYVWVGGVWMRPPHARAVWVPARWVQDRRHGRYVEQGHWK